MVRRVMMEISDEHILMVDSSKLGSRSLSVIAPPTAFTRVITDERADAEWCAELEQLGVSLTKAAIYT